MGVIWFIIIGGLAGWIANELMKRGPKSILRNIVLGIVGGFVGGWVFGLLRIDTSDGFIGSLVTALVGAIIVIWIADKLKK